MCTREQTIGSHRAGTADEGVRLDVFLLRNCPAFPSKKSAYKAVKRGDIAVNGQRLREPHHRLSRGDVVAVMSDSRPPSPPLRLRLSVIYEDDWLAVVEKPPGLPVSGNFAKTLLRTLPFNLSPSPATDSLRSPQTVHRLDSPTGGVLLVAKTAGALADLGHQFENRDIYKNYQAIVAGDVADRLTVRAPLDDREAVTHICVLERIESLNHGHMCRVACHPVTGRTHQIRRHLAGLGSPIAGDRQYGDPGRTLKGKGLFLWAVEIAFRHPASGVSFQVVIPPPPKFSALLKREVRRSTAFAAAMPTENGGDFKTLNDRLDQGRDEQ